MSGTLSISAAIARLGTMAAAARAAQRPAMARACAIVQREARDAVGHGEQAHGPFPAWPALAEATQRERVREGFTPDAPLLRSGSLRESIGVAVADSGRGGVEGVVGSESEVAVFQELGTARIPPRSFLGASALRVADQVAGEFGRVVAAALAGRAAGGDKGEPVA